MNQTRITSGDNEIIASGLVIAFENKPVIFQIEHLKFRMEFIDEEGKSEPNASYFSPNQQELVIKCLNFKNPLGSGNDKPVAIGKVKNRKLFLSYRIYQMQGGDKTVHYTFYLGEAEVAA
jgi:single-stranded DNA-specific DHH superfamily exonuclease